jgi:hypothetical protein
MQHATHPGFFHPHRKMQNPPAGGNLSNPPEPLRNSASVS